MHNIDVSIIIVNYNTKELLQKCLTSIYEQCDGVSFETIVSDNGSTDGSVEMLKVSFPQVILLENRANLGFGTANNRGLTIAKGRYVFYLNSDTILLNNAIKLFFEYWETHDAEPIGALGCNLIDEDDNYIHSYGAFPDLKKIRLDIIRSIYGLSKIAFLHLLCNRAIPASDAEAHTEKFIGEVEYITGADLFMKNDAHARFDEKFFMYCEEADLEYRLAKAGKTRLLIDGPRIIHLVNGSFKKKKRDMVQDSASAGALYNMISRIYFFKKNGASAFNVCLLKALTLLLWLNPLIVSKTKKYMIRMLRA